MIEVSINEITYSLIAGMIIGIIFFGGLWLTVHKLLISKHPAWLMASSLLLRFGIVLLAFYWLVTDLHWQALLVSLVGFIFARLLLVRLLVEKDWGQSNEH